MTRFDRNIPVPPLARDRWPLRQMQPGDSILITGSPETLQKVRGVAWVTSHRLGWKFRTQTQEGGVRIWRIS